MRVGWLTHERYLWHDTGTGAGTRAAGGWIEPATHIEHPATKRRLRSLVEVSGILDTLVPLRPRPATMDEVCAVHDVAHVEQVRDVAAAGGGLAGENVPIGRDSFEIALLSSGGAIVAVEAVLEGTVDRCYALVRPPGHHAEAGLARGFCVFNNCAIAVRAAQRRGIGRAAILDWDVHHGNGAQQIFWDDPSVLTISIHQDGLYPPEGGALDETGGPAAPSTNLNVPLPGSGEGAYVAAFEHAVLPALERFRPELIVVACGFDAAALDPLGRMLLRSHSFRRLTALVCDVAGRVCDGRVVFCHEGGYSESYVPFCGLAVLEQLANVTTPVADPYFSVERELPFDGLQEHQRRIVVRAGDLAGRVPAIGRA